MKFASSVAALTCLCAFALPAAAADNAGALRQRQQAQEKARALAGELISAVLDVQLRQLAENGLTTLPIYRDIDSMKGNLAELVDSEMAQIVELLVEAQSGTPQQRLEKLNAARGQVREVVVRLMAERQKLHRRMQVARLAADVKQLMALQSHVQETTESLPQRRQDERERLALAVIEDQADVGRLYYQLLAALEDVSTWGGPPSAGAADGLRIVKAAQVEPELKQAAAALARGEFAGAGESQHAVVRGLAALLQRLEQVQGVASGDRQHALMQVRALRAAQQTVREETRKTALNERTAQPLIERETAIQSELGKLAEALAAFPTTEPLVEEAKAAAFEAVAHLFEEKQTPALEQQNRVIGNLAQIEKVLEQGIDAEHSDKSADELAAEVQRLQELRAQLAAATQQQTEATTAAGANPQQASNHEQQTAETLASADQQGPYASTIDAALATAREKVADSQESLQNTAAEAAPRRQAAAERAGEAIQHAQAEVEAHLADTQRRQKAVEVGELARAAEALERAAAAERQVAKLAARAAEKTGLTAEQAAALAQEQSGVGQVARKISAGVKSNAPSASQLLDAAQPIINETAQQLAAAQEQPGAANKPLAKAAGQTAQQLASELTKAAAEVRREQGRAAQDLTKIAGEQLAQAEAARQAVAAVSPAGDNESSEAAKYLEQAREQLRKALAAQRKAQGRSEEAAAVDLVERIATAQRQQQSADQAARDLAGGRAKSPLNAAARQQDVSDQANQLAQQSPDDISKSLQQAARSASEAARQTLGGNPGKADAARAATKQSLAQAQAAAAKMAQQAASAPPGAPDLIAQARAAERAGEAGQSLDQAQSAAGKAGENAASALQQAEQQAATAERALAQGQSAAAKAAQEQARRALEQASQEVQQALADLAKRRAAQLAEKSQQLGQLNAQAAKVDPGAAAALAQAQQAAKSSGQPGQSQPSGASDQFARKIEQAEANLAAREQQLRRDRDLAETLAQLAQDQQAARDAIAEAAEQLEKLGDPGSVAASPLDFSKQLAAAQSLQEAQQDFAASQTATGEGAAEVSGQQQVANQPIREGLETASMLNQSPAAGGRQPPSEGAPSGQSPPTGPGSENAGQGQGQGQPGQGQPGKNGKPGQNGQQGQPSAQGQPGEGQPGAGQPSQLGTGMVPNSAQATAQQIAGPQANAAAASAMAAQGQGQQPGEGKGESNQDGAASSTASKGGAAKGGESAQNQDQPKGDLQTADAPMADSRGELAEHDAAAGGVGPANEPWFAKLPPSLRAAIQSKSRGKAPRGYEDRLRRYFETVD